MGGIIWCVGRISMTKVEDVNGAKMAGYCLPSFTNLRGCHTLGRIDYKGFRYRGWIRASYLQFLSSHLQASLWAAITFVGGAL